MEVQDFKTIVDVIKQYQLHMNRIEFIDFDSIAPFPLTEEFLEDLKFSLANVGTDDKEAFMCEFVIVPFLKKVWRSHQQLDVFSHVQLKSKDFTVISDYLVAYRNKLGYKAVEKPLLVTVEAKYEQFQAGWFQASMQMLAAQEMNDNLNVPIYGIVTTGDLWQFGKLEGKNLYQHPVSVAVKNPQEVAGILSYIFGECEKNAKLMD